MRKKRIQESRKMGKQYLGAKANGKNDLWFLDNGKKRDKFRKKEEKDFRFKENSKKDEENNYKFYQLINQRSKLNNFAYYY